MHFWVLCSFSILRFWKSTRKLAWNIPYMPGWWTSFSNRRQCRVLGAHYRISHTLPPRTRLTSIAHWLLHWIGGQQPGQGINGSLWFGCYPGAPCSMHSYLYKTHTHWRREREKGIFVCGMFSPAARGNLVAGRQVGNWQGGEEDWGEGGGDLRGGEPPYSGP